MAVRSNPVFTHEKKLFEAEFAKKSNEKKTLLHNFNKKNNQERSQELALLKKKLAEKLEILRAQNLENSKTLQEARNYASKKGGFYRNDEPKVIFAIRLKGINKIAPKPKKILQLLRLRQINNGVFIKANKATIEMLNKVTPFITYGYPSLKTIRQLIYKRGYGKIGKPGSYSRIRLLNNSTVSDALKSHNILGIEDLIHEIHSCGPKFKAVNNFLWPFKLSCPTGGWIAKRRGFCDPRGGDWGNREEYINDLIRKMN